MQFMFYEDLAISLAKDFRSEYVRKELTQDRKIKILNEYKDTVMKAYESALIVEKKLS